MSYLRKQIVEILKITFSFTKALAFVWDSSRKWVIINVILLVFQGALPVVSLYMMKVIIDSVTLVLNSPVETRTVQPILQAILLAGAVSLITSIVSQIGDTVTRIQGLVVIDYMNDILQAKGIEMDLEYYENSEYQDTLHRAQREAAFRPLTILNGLAQIARSGISLLGVGWLLVSFHWSVLPILLIAVMPGILVKTVFSKRQYKLEREYTATERRTWYFHMLTISVEFAKEVRIFGLGETLRQRYQALRSKLRGLRIKIEVQHSFFAVIAQMISTAVIYGIYAAIAYQTVIGTNTLGDLVMYFQAFQRGESFLRSFLNGFVNLYENNLFLTNLYEFLNLRKKIAEPDTPINLPDPISQGIRFENVSFRYPNTSRTVLKEVNITIQPGEVIALVGENGSGKTTLIKLLCRLYDVDEGCIKIDGIDIRNFRSKELRHNLGVIFQDYARYDLTASDNIWFGDVEQPQETDRIIRAAKYADAHQVIDGLKNGYNTILGTLFPNGQQLSIGQWQKVALARAFFRKSQVMILDEPTSALDPKAEYELFLKFRELLNGRTAILISHRLSTVRMANRIYVIRNGQIIESGTHDELLHLSGTYAQLFEQQAQSYR